MHPCGHPGGWLWGLGGWLVGQRQNSQMLRDIFLRGPPTVKASPGGWCCCTNSARFVVMPTNPFIGVIYCNPQQDPHFNLCCGDEESRRGVTVGIVALCVLVVDPWPKHGIRLSVTLRHTEGRDTWQQQHNQQQVLTIYPKHHMASRCAVSGCVCPMYTAGQLEGL